MPPAGFDVAVQTDMALLGVLATTLAAALALALALFGRTRLPRVPLTALLALCGAGLGLGAGWIEGSPFTDGLGVQRLIAVAVLALLTPFHVRVVLGPLGRKG